MFIYINVYGSTIYDCAINIKCLSLYMNIQAILTAQNTEMRKKKKTRRKRRKENPKKKQKIA